VNLGLHSLGFLFLGLLAFLGHLGGYVTAILRGRRNNSQVGIEHGRTPTIQTKIYVLNPVLIIYSWVLERLQTVMHNDAQHVQVVAQHWNSLASPKWSLKHHQNTFLSAGKKPSVDQMVSWWVTPRINGPKEENGQTNSFYCCCSQFSSVARHLQSKLIIEAMTMFPRLVLICVSKRYPLVNKHSYWKWPSRNSWFTQLENGDFSIVFCMFTRPGTFFVVRFEATIYG